MSRILTGVCQTENGPCSGKMSASVTGYSLDKLSSITDKLDPLSPLTKWVTKNAGYLSLVVLVIYGGQVFYSLVIMGITYSTAGVEAGLSTLYIFLCPGAHQMMRARTRALRGSKEDGNDQEMQKVLPSKDQAIPPEYEQETMQ